MRHGPSLVSLLTAFLAACGGGGSDSPAPVAPPPPAPPPPPQSYQAAGAAYTRDANVAYPPDFVPPTGLANAQVTFGPASTTTNATGSFSLRSTFTLGVDYIPISATAPGHAATWQPWTPPDSARPIPLALYPERPVTPRPGFIKSIIFSDGGGNIPGWFAAGHVPTTVARVRDVVHGNAMSYVVTLVVRSYDANAPLFEAVDDPNTNHAVTFPAVSAAIQAAGLQRILRIIVFSPTLEQNPSGVPLSNTAFWDVVFARVEAFVLKRTREAQEAGFDHVVIDLPAYMSRAGTARLRPIYEGARATGFRGKLFAGFHANFSRAPVPHRHYAAVDDEFWKLVDGAVVYVGNVVARAPGEVGNLPRAQSRASMRAGIRVLLDELAQLPVPVILELAPPSVHGGASVGENVEQLFRQLVRDYQQQADVFQAAAEEIDVRPAGPGPGRVIGLQSWGYLWNENLREFEYWGRPLDAWDKFPTVRGKPAESVLRWWFDRW